MSDFFVELNKRLPGKRILLNMAEIQEWIDAGLTSEEMLQKLQQMCIEIDELEKLVDPPGK